MHAKSDSEVTSTYQSTSLSRSPRRLLYYVQSTSLPRSPLRLLYYIQSPLNHDVEKMSYGSSLPASPPHQFQYHCSPIHHSRESSTSHFSASLRNTKSNGFGWRRLQKQQGHVDEEIEEEDETEDSCHNIRLYSCFFLLFSLLFTLFSLILWGASKSYKPQIHVKNVVFENFNIQAGNDGSGVPTDMLTLNSTVKIMYRNPATFFGVHVSTTPFQLSYYQLPIASGQMQKFYQSRKSERLTKVVFLVTKCHYMEGSRLLGDAREQPEKVSVLLNLTFVMRSRAYILGKLVKSKFHRRIRCSVTLQGNKLGKPLKLSDSCVYK